MRYFCLLLYFTVCVVLSIRLSGKPRLRSRCLKMWTVAVYVSCVVFTRV